MTMLVGTSAYMAPYGQFVHLTSLLSEVVNSRSYNLKCDVYSFGIILYEVMFDTTRAYDSMEALNLELQAAKNPNFRPKIKEQAYSDAETMVIQLMKQCWTHDPQERPSFDQVVDALSVAINTF